MSSAPVTDSLRRADNTDIIQYMMRNIRANIRPSARFRRCLEPPAITGDLSPLRLSRERAQHESSRLRHHGNTNAEFSTEHIGVKKGGILLQTREYVKAEAAKSPRLVKAKESLLYNSNREH